jgi:hypothetical protein
MRDSVGVNGRGGKGVVWEGYVSKGQRTEEEKRHLMLRVRDVAVTSAPRRR